MENFFRRVRSLFPTNEEINKAISSFSKNEYFFFVSFVLIFCISAIILLIQINRHFMIEIPANGGTLREGIVGTPRFINPIMASTAVDSDMTNLVYAGLMKKNENNTLIPDLAQGYTVSENKLEYTFTLKDKIFFHDGKPVTIDDVIFTIEKTKDPIIHNPQNGNWDTVSVEKIDEKSVKFILDKPFASFLDNTTIGIMPKHIWANSPIELNTTNISPIGSGPYKINKVSKQSSGVVEYYELSVFPKYHLTKPFIKNLIVRFYLNEEDQLDGLEKGDIEQAGAISPVNAKKLQDKGYKIQSSVLPRVFGLFFNQNQNQIFTDKNVINAINLAINKKEIIDTVLNGYGKQLDGPTPFGMMSYDRIEAENEISHEENLKKSSELLSKDGWQMSEDGVLEKTKTEKNVKTTTKLEFSISTGNASDLAKSAEIIKSNLEKIGIKVNVKTFDLGNLNQSVIRPRNYESLLFGEIINHDSDLYAFWHSSQRKDPGLNVALYTNSKVDKILEEAFTITDKEKRLKKYIDFDIEIKKDTPAVFLYSPEFLYVVSKNTKGLDIKNMVSSKDRFVGITTWFTEVDKVWKIFSK